MMKATAKVKPCIVEAGTNTRKRFNFNAQASNVKIPATMAKAESIDAPWVSANAASRPDKAPVGPTILKRLPPKKEANSPAQIAVMMPAMGVDSDATAKETESGMDTRATVKPDFQFSFIRDKKGPSAARVIEKRDFFRPNMLRPSKRVSSL